MSTEIKRSYTLSRPKLFFLTETVFFRVTDELGRRILSETRQ